MSWLANRFGSWLLMQRGRFTPAGWIMAVALGFSVSVGLDTDNSAAYQAFTVFAGFLLVGFLWTVRFKPMLDLERQLPRFGTAGEPLSYWVHVRNRSRRTQRGLELAERLGNRRLRVREWLGRLRPDPRARSFGHARIPSTGSPAACRFHPLPDLAPRTVTTARAEITPLRRGPLLLDAVTIGRPDPLGLVRAFVHFLVPQTVLVLPRRYLLPDISLPGRDRYQQGGVNQASSVGRSEEFVSLRDYRRGDPMRHIHWRSWARVGEPIVKEFEDDCFVRHGLVLDTFDDPLDEGPFEEAVSVAASFACQLGTQESLLDLMFVGVEAFRFTAGRGLGGADQMLEILACAQLSRKRDFSLLSGLVLQHAPGLTACVLVLLKWDAPRQDLTRRLVRQGLDVRVFVVQQGGRDRRLEAGDVGLDQARFLELRAGRIQEDLATTP